MILALTSRNIKEIFRNKMRIGFLLGMPLAFMLIFNVAFGSSGEETINVGFINFDDSEISTTFVENISDVSGINVIAYDNEENALKDLKDGNILAYMTIPEDFGDNMMLIWNNQEAEINLKIKYDETLPNTASKFISIIRTYTLQFSGVSIPINIDSDPINISYEKNLVNFFAPGIVIFGLMVLIPTAGGMITHDKEKGFMERILTTPVSSTQILLGYSLPLFIVALIQIAIYMGAGFALGMRVYGNIFLLFAVYMLTALWCIGIGMIISAWAKREDQAEPFSWIFMIPVAMLSGLWFPLEGMHPIVKTIANLFPSTYSVDAARALVLKGSEFSAISNSIYILIVTTMILFLVGIILFKKLVVK
ncbi:MAG: ABC transporter permease [Methanomicrobia archaeon]|nr:ABC transporter permease [Methanomicrobia archaeon]